MKISNLEKLAVRSGFKILAEVKNGFEEFASCTNSLNSG